MRFRGDWKSGAIACRVAFSTGVALLACGCESLAPPLRGEEVAGFSGTLREEMARLEEPKGPITIDQAVARAVIMNQKVRAKELEVLLAGTKVTSIAVGMLPKIVAESDYYRRDRPQMSRTSFNGPYSTSSDPATSSRNITLTWNILDFGLSYLRARQGANRVHQQREELRVIRGRVAEETSVAFWRAVALDQLEPGLRGLDGEVRGALAMAGRAMEDSRLDPASSINVLRDLLERQRELDQIHASIAGARHELHTQIGVNSNSQIVLDRSRGNVEAGLLVASADADVATALAQRAEIRQSLYDLEITRDEIDATIVQLLPGFTLSAGANSDSNSHLLHGDWVSWGTKVAGNLVNLIRLETDLEVVRDQWRVQRQTALATAASIVMQVHVARARIAVARKAWRDAERYADVQRKLLRQVRATVEAGRMGKQSLTREKLATLLAEVRATLAHGELQGALAAHASARGDDFGPADAGEEDGHVALRERKANAAGGDGR